MQIRLVSCVIFPILVRANGYSAQHLCDKSVHACNKIQFQIVKNVDTIQITVKFSRNSNIWQFTAQVQVCSSLLPETNDQCDHLTCWSSGKALGSHRQGSLPGPHLTVGPLY